MYDVKQFTEQAAAILRAHRVVQRIVSHAKDRRIKYGKACELRMMKIGIGHCITPEVNIEVWLNSHTGGFAGYNLDDREKREYATDDKKARAFVLAVLGDFKVKARRHAERPDTLRAELPDGVILHFYGFPTGVSYKCEKKCVAVLPGGKTVELSDIPIES